jgi:hypothetical protein
MTDIQLLPFQIYVLDHALRSGKSDIPSIQEAKKHQHHEDWH